MDKFATKGERLAALSLLGFLLFNYPFLALFNRTGTFFGIPLLYAYIFVVWALLVAAVAVIADTRDQ